MMQSRGAMMLLLALIGLALVIAIRNVDVVVNVKVSEIPRCVEDEMIRGTGDFEDGRWTRYECVHPDNL